jgi:hypothetical protein
MRTSYRVIAALCGAMLLSAGAAGSARQNRPVNVPLSPDGKKLRLNEYGAVIQDEGGREYHYTARELEEQARAAGRSPAGRLPSERGAVPPDCEGSGFSASAAWQYAAMGGDIGATNILLAENGEHREIYFSTYSSSMWMALRYDPATHSYDQAFVSPYLLQNGIAAMRLGDVSGDDGLEIVVALEDGRVLVYDQATKTLQTTIVTGAQDVTALDLADVDGDHALELVIGTSSALRVHSLAGELEWSVASCPSTDLAIAQMDTDAALEIGVPAGRVVDCSTHAVQWTWPDGQFGSFVDAEDVDGDGMHELIATQGAIIWTYDVDRRLPKWSLQTDMQIEALTMANVDADPVREALVGDYNWDGVTAFDCVTRTSDGTVSCPQPGTTSIATGDADGDGSMDILWGAGAGISSEDYLCVADWPTKQLEWRSQHLDGPFASPAIGDVDGDGVRELVTISYESDSGYGSGRILVFDARTRRLRAMSNEIVGNFSWSGARDIKLRDVNGDGDDEILVGADRLYEGVIEVYDLDASNTFTLLRTNTTRPRGSPFNAVDAADLDGDGTVELIAVNDIENTGSPGNYLYVYDFATGNLEWQSFQMGWAWTGMTGVEVADFDGDGVPEMAALRHGHAVYVFDGLTKDIEAILFGPYTALRTRKVGNDSAIAVGTSAGEIVTFGYTGDPTDPYAETDRITASSQPIDGFDYDGLGRAFVGSDNRVRVVDSTGACLWLSEDFGLQYGAPSVKRVAFLPGTRTFFAAGPYSVVAFTSGTGYHQRTAGTYDAASGSWFLRNANTPGAADLVFGYGPSGIGWIPVTGDWNGDGIDTPGLYDPATGFFFLRNANAPGAADLVFGFGPGGLGWTPMVGDWNGDGVDTVGLYDPATGFFFLRNANAPGAADLVFGFGPSGVGWAPIAGDWNGDGVDTVGLYDGATGFYFLRNRNAPGAADLLYGFGPPGLEWAPIAGDWDGDGADTVGLYDGTTGFFVLRNAHAGGPADVVFGYGAPEMTPVLGDWDGQ